MLTPNSKLQTPNSRPSLAPMPQRTVLVALRNARPLDQHPRATLGRTVRDSRCIPVLEKVANTPNDTGKEQRARW